MGCYGRKWKYSKNWDECFNLRCPVTDECIEESRKSKKQKNI